MEQSCNSYFYDAEDVERPTPVIFASLLAALAFVVTAPSSLEAS